MKVTFDPATNTLTIPEVAGVNYLIDGEVVTGTRVIEQDTVVTAEPKNGFTFTEGAETTEEFKVQVHQDQDDYDS